MASVRAAGFFLFLFFLAVCLQATDCVTVILGDPFEVPERCGLGESGSLLRDMGHEGTRQVATYQRGQWTVSPEYRDRMETNLSKIVFIRMQYNDGGIYEVTCSKTGTKYVQLEVVYAEKLLVTEGDNVTLHCYYKTRGKPGLTVRWVKNGKPVCVKNSNYKGCNGTPDDRLSIPTDWITSGNLSLTIEGVQDEDSGDYFCYIQDQHGEQSGTPEAHRLTVTEKMTHQINSSTAAPGNTTQSCSEHTQPWQISTWILLVILLLVALVALCLWRCGKISCDSGKNYKLAEKSCHPSNSNEATTSV
ncbi:uncharacterized protein LOC129352353 [Poeciliopsis prolifica]|uniref:uncharacterized protein LOC129352353 n=1 Tax=Poeciliopsis prolifica TaxID=188132 RepID=UPI002413F7C6|nr:uncharacterized protein LOC129352353 [Poeciliopsis prolifica]